MPTNCHPRLRSSDGERLWRNKSPSEEVISIIANNSISCGKLCVHQEKSFERISNAKADLNWLETRRDNKDRSSLKVSDIAVVLFLRNIYLRPSRSHICCPIREHIFIYFVAFSALTREIRFSLLPNHRPSLEIDSNFHFHNAFNEAIEDTYDKDHRSVYQ